MIFLEKLTGETIQLVRKWRNKNRHYFIHKQLITHKQQEKWYEQYIRDLGRWYFIVCCDDKKIGFIGMSCISNDEARIETVLLGEEEYRRNGYMGVALEKIMTLFPYKTYSLLVLKNNAVAISFYKKNGFTVVNENDTCYIMHK